MAKPKIKRHVSNSEIQSALRLNVLSGAPKRKDGPMTIPHLVPKGGEAKRKETNWGDRKWAII